MPISPFHEGELALQRGAGSMARLAEVGPRFIRDHMPEQHREFFAQLPFVVIGALDSQGQPWASVLAGPPGFAHSPDPRQLAVRARPWPGDPLAQALGAGASLALLGIEAHTRRRNRLNGHITRSDGEGLAMHVDQSFGNCPKYIQARKPEFAADSACAGAAQRHDALDDAALRMVERADTFFIATAHPMAGDSDSPSFGVDVSHRGGKRGFVRADGRSRLTVPDFAGNLYFNTLGNVALNPRCGLLFIDFDHGGLLYLAARGEIVAGGPEVEAFQGAQRLLRLQLVSAVYIPAALPLRWSAPELSPALENTGRWRG
jgi:predicted pyridoxine 5'-phosphate oxidase superfamily flavin-nucleotide-binding protein